jgi:hypothetical protein
LSPDPESSFGQNCGPQQQQQQLHKHAQQHHRRAPLLQEGSLQSDSNFINTELSGASLLGPSPAAAAAAGGEPQPRSVKPRPSVTQQQQQRRLVGHSSSGEAAPAYDGAAAAAVAAAGRGVLCSEGERWAQNAIILAKQQAREMQQQNDALVRVLERERQDHTRTRQQVGLVAMNSVLGCLNTARLHCARQGVCAGLYRCRVCLLSASTS